MKSKTTQVSFLILLFLFFSQCERQPTEIELARKKHAEFLKKNPFKEVMNLSRKERKERGLPPNLYFEQEYLLEMNPRTGRPDYEKKMELQASLLQKLRTKSVPGVLDNAWVERGPNNVPGRTRAMLFDPNGNGKRVFAGGVSGGLWVNEDITNQNSSWSQVAIPENLAVSSITVDPNNSDIWYLGTGESYVQGQVNGNGIWKSTDGGQSWTHIYGGATGPSKFVGGSEVIINSPASLASNLSAVRASFGPVFNAPISGNLVLVNDGTLSAAEGCNTVINAAALNGNIAVVERGTCNFTVKIKNAQDAGARAVVVINNVAGFPSLMGGSDPTINIPSVMISKADGAAILAAIEGTVINVRLDDVATNGPTGFLSIPGIFHINDIVARNNDGVTEIYASVAESIYRDAQGHLLGNEYGLFKSVNGGITWFNVGLPLSPSGNPVLPNDLEISTNNTVWVTTMNSASFGDGGGAIYAASDGSNFVLKKRQIGADRTEISLSKTNPNKVYALYETGNVLIQKTVDGFANTISVNLPEDVDEGIDAADFTRGQAFYDLMIEVDPLNDEVVYVGGIDVFRSTNGGANWTQISKWSNNNKLRNLKVPYVHADIHALVFDPSNSDRALIGTDGGVFYANSLSAASGSETAIFSVFKNYNTTQFYSVAIGQKTTNEQLLAGAQDNGTNFINYGVNGINAAEEIAGGDGGYCFIDKEGAYLITSFTRNKYRRFSLPTPGASVTIVNDSDSGLFINPADLDDNLEILYTNGSTSSEYSISRFDEVDKSNSSRTALKDARLTSTPTVIRVSPFTTTSTTLFVGTAGGQLFKITNANSPGLLWTEITGDEFLGSISDIRFGASQNEILVTFHNYGVSNIWYSTNGGSTWMNKEGDFPDLPVKAIMMNPLRNDEVIIGTDLGVWRTSNFKDANPTWKQSQNGMKNVKVTSFDLRTSDQTVAAATYGRGLFTGKFTATSLGLAENELSGQLILFPNPSRGKFLLKNAVSLGETYLEVYDITGKKVYHKTLNFSDNQHIDLHQLKAGVYVLKGVSERGTFAKKVIIN
ncbi:T9SS type A sorting domain-containing protein [Flavobacteriaceae bacterium F08102]|nr:T9SS type A sorting domain-containing protein [Flavobacteriaceae bacterium F08102]